MSTAINGKTFTLLNGDIPVRDFANSPYDLLVFTSADAQAIEACRQFPNAQYFTWASDHDIYHRSWFSALVAELEANSSANLAWSFCGRIDADDNPIERPVHRFETRGLANPIERFRVTLKASLNGETVVRNMAHGLFPRDAVTHGPGQQYLLMPVWITQLGHFLEN